jgi:hypothetical protein
MSRWRQLLLGALAVCWAFVVLAGSVLAARLERPDPLAGCDVVALSGGGAAYCLRPR